MYYIATLLLVNLRIHIMNSRNVLHMLITVILFIPVFTWTNLFLPTAGHNTHQSWCLWFFQTHRTVTNIWIMNVRSIFIVKPLFGSKNINKNTQFTWKKQEYLFVIKYRHFLEVYGTVNICKWGSFHRDGWWWWVIVVGFEGSQLKMEEFGSIVAQ